MLWLGILGYHHCAVHPPWLEIGGISEWLACFVHVMVPVLFRCWLVASSVLYMDVILEGLIWLFRCRAMAYPGG